MGNTIVYLQIWSTFILQVLTTKDTNLSVSSWKDEVRTGTWMTGKTNQDG